MQFFFFTPTERVWKFAIEHDLKIKSFVDLVKFIQVKAESIRANHS